MEHRGHLTIAASDLKEALMGAVPKLRKNARFKPFPITIGFDAPNRQLEIEEALYGKTGYSVVADGHWPESLQVEGRKLRACVETLGLDETVVFLALDKELRILCRRATFDMPRLDPAGTPGIKKQKIPTPRNHKGPVEVPPDPVCKRVELNDTWLLSARVPVPQHRDPKK